MNEIKSINWLENSGSQNEKYYMVFSIYEACDIWGKRYMEVWEPQIYVLEDMTEEKIGDNVVDKVFAAVSAAIGNTVWEKFGDTAFK